MKKCLTIISGLFILVSITHAQQLLIEKNNKNLINAPMLRLGDGYTSYDRMGRGQSALNMALTSVSYGDKQTEIYLSQAISRDDLSKTLNIYASASGGWGPFSASASANYMRYTDDTQYTENFTYKERYYANGLLDISNLHSGVRALSQVAADTYNDNFNVFTNRFGDSFVKQLPFGAVLLINVQMQFNSATDKQAFDSAIGGNFGSIFNASVTIQNIVNSARIKGNLEISAYQLGGDPTELAKIFTKNPSGEYYFTLCQLSNLANCSKALTGVIDYAQNNFSKQIKDATASGAPPQGNLAVVGSPVIDSYALEFGLKPVPALSQEALTARYQLATLYSKIIHDKNVVEHLSGSVEAMKYIDETAIRDTIQILNWNVGVFDTQNAMSCYLPGQEENCPGTLSSIQANIRSYSDKYNDMYVITCSEQTVRPTCSKYIDNICNIYSGTRYISYPYDSTSYFGALSGQFTQTVDNHTLDYEGMWIPPSGPEPGQKLSGKFTLNSDKFYQASQSQLEGFGAFCSGDVYIRRFNNPF